MTRGKRSHSDQFDAQMDESLYVAFEAYAKAVDAARAASDRMLAEGRAEDVNALFGLIIASWKLTEMHSDVLKLTRGKMGTDLRRTEQRVHDGLQALQRPGFVYTTEHVYKELRAKDNAARIAKVQQKVDNKENAQRPRGPRFPFWMVELAATLDAATPRPTAKQIADAIETEAPEHPDEPGEKNT